MKKLLLIPLFLYCFSIAYAQENPSKWVSSTFLNAMVNNKIIYTYHDLERWQEKNLVGKGAFLAADIFNETAKACNWY